MLGLMFVMGMYDTTLNEKVGEEEAQTFLTTESVKKAIKTINCCAKVPHQALQLMLLVNALGLGKGNEEFETTAEPSWTHGFLSMLTGLLCAIGGLIFLVRVAQRRQPHDAVLQQVAEAPNQQRDPAVMNEMDTESDELDESAEPILNAERGTENAPASTDHAEDLARMLRHHGLPPAYARYSPEHMILWMIIRGQGRIARHAGTNRGRLWTLRVRALTELLQHVRTCTEATVRQRAMTTMLDAGDFSSDDDSPSCGDVPDHRHQYIEDVQQARDFADHVISTMGPPDAGPIDDVIEAQRLMNNTGEENMEEETPTSDVLMDGDENNYTEMIAMHRERRRAMQVFRANRDAALELGNREEAAYWESQEDQLLLL